MAGESQVVTRPAGLWGKRPSHDKARGSLHVRALRGEPLDRPASSGTPVAQPVVQPPGPAGPELPGLRHHPVAAPARWRRHVGREARRRRRPALRPAQPAKAPPTTGRWPRPPAASPAAGSRSRPRPRRGPPRPRLPTTRTCRDDRVPGEHQGRARVRGQLDRLGRAPVGEEPEPAPSYPLRSTVRAEGAPAASAVARTIALGSTTPAAAASANQRPKATTGSGPRSPTSTPACS